MSCCGRATTFIPELRRPRATNPNQVRVTYLGHNTLNVRGTYSGRLYAFSPTSRVHGVAADDSRVMLRTPYFRRVA